MTFESARCVQLVLRLEGMGWKLEEVPSCKDNYFFSHKTNVDGENLLATIGYNKKDNKWFFVASDYKDNKQEVVVLSLKEMGTFTSLMAELCALKNQKEEKEKKEDSN